MESNLKTLCYLKKGEAKELYIWRLGATRHDSLALLWIQIHRKLWCNSTNFKYPENYEVMSIE